jgi:hypothetical protein
MVEVDGSIGPLATEEDGGIRAASLPVTRPSLRLCLSSFLSSSSRGICRHRYLARNKKRRGRTVRRYKRKEETDAIQVQQKYSDCSFKCTVRQKNSCHAKFLPRSRRDCSHDCSSAGRSARSSSTTRTTDTMTNSSAGRSVERGQENTTNENGGRLIEA